MLADDSETSKHGVTPDGAIDLARHIRENCPFLRFKGLMSMGELGNVKEFRAVHDLKLKMLEEFTEFKNPANFVISMGTSHDYEEAIIEGGSNEIRLGTTIFGARDYSKRK